MNRAKALKALAEKGMTQREVADMIGISPTMFSKYMHNRNVMRVDMAIRTAGILGLTVNELFGGERDD